MKILHLLIRLFVSLLLLFSSYKHLDNNYQLIDSIHDYQILGSSQSIVLAALLPYFQAVIGLTLLIIPRHDFSAFFMAGLLFLIFSFAQIYVYRSDKSIDCGCFGDWRQPIGELSIALAASGFIASALGCFLSWREARRSSS